MFDGMRNEEIAIALDGLISCFGVKEDISPDALYDLLEKSDTEGCVQEIARLLELPIRISLSYVPKDYRPDNANSFRSSSLSKTDWTGRGTEGIIAQVSIPPHMPMYGTSSFQGYSISVRVSENCSSHPETFVAIMAHELSHVLLAALMSPYKDSELHTDLVPIILGFRDAVRMGRKRFESKTSGNTTTTHTTTYGYLTDSQFEYACGYVLQKVEINQRTKDVLTVSVNQLNEKISKASRILAAFRVNYEYLDNKPPVKMKPEHAMRVVQLHSQDYSLEWETRINELRACVNAAELFVKDLDHYTKSSIEHITSHTRTITAATSCLVGIVKDISEDERILRKYVGILLRIRGTVMQYF